MNTDQFSALAIEGAQNYYNYLEANVPIAVRNVDFVIETRFAGIIFGLLFATGNDICFKHSLVSLSFIGGSSRHQ